MGDTVRTDPVDDFMLGIQAGQKSIAALALSQSMEDQEKIRRLQRKLRVSRRENRRGRATCVVVALVTAIAVYNLTLHGVTL